MTNELSPFLPLAGFGGFDYLVSGTQPSEKGVAPAQRNTCRLWDQKGDPVWLGRGEIVVHGFEQGYNHPEGDFSQNANGFAWSDLVTNLANELVPPPATLSLGDGSIAGNIVGFHTVYAFNTLIMGLGSAANHALFKETSTTDPTPVAITYTPTNEICSLTRTLTSGAERLMVGRVGAAAQLLSDASGTVATTMHANTASMWGCILSGVNADPTKAGVPQLNMYYGTNLGYLSSDATMTNAPTNTHTVNAGGKAIGAIKPGGRPQMSFWLIPQVTNTAGAFKFLGSQETARMDIYATPMDMSADIIPVNLKYLPNGVLDAAPFRDGLLARDEDHLVYWDGDKEYDLGIFRRRLNYNTKSATATTINHDIQPKLRGIIVNGAQCGALWQWVHADSGSAVNTAVQVEMYNFEAGTWHNASTRTTTGAPTLETYISTGSAMSPAGRRYWWCQTGETIYGAFIPRESESLLWQHSIGSGETSTTAMPQFTNDTLLMGCRWRIDSEPPGTIPGVKTIARMPKVIYETEFNGNLDYGGSNWTFTIAVYGYSNDGTTRQLAYNQTYNQGQPSAHYVRKNPTSAWANITDIQLFLTAGASGTTRRSVQLVPFTVRFLYSKDGRKITPEEAINAANRASLTDMA